MSTLAILRAQPYNDYWICAQMIKDTEDHMRWLSLRAPMHSTFATEFLKTSSLILEELNKQLERLLMAELNREKESTYS